MNNKYYIERDIFKAYEYQTYPFSVGYLSEII